ncbi:hypothetical protein Srot_3033 [Segniliparus rotundus DSM 44985]|uniref:Uncharacterized protein n=1 Tax=Segniliparus rotundus (strain ATCC BAA-972 / CDC 1076 / CIP 108378 / DSM 44985 / JCM 13578) TaxID=640132 RepID=D6ZEI2_SEGRD|nr:hypothetical protein [Segniliparus rotundus]ADG99458.1 hypothetical protein Srot_3033 [Segniliparus rotundus DSM 44985]
MRTLVLAAVVLAAAAAAGLSSAALADAAPAPDDSTSVDVTRTVPAARQGALGWATYTVTVRPGSADLVVRNGAGDDVSHSSTPLRDGGGRPVLQALADTGGSCQGGPRLVQWRGGEIVDDRAACSGPVDAALTPVDEALGLPNVLSQMAGPSQWPADPNGEPLQPGRQPYI